MKAYLLEDNKEYTNEFTKFLTKKGVKCITCSTLEGYKYEKADVYFIDLKIGDDFSFKVMRDIRKQGNNFIVVITHLLDKDIIDLAIESGAKYVINKLDTEMYTIHLQVIKNFLNKA